MKCPECGYCESPMLLDIGQALAVISLPTSTETAVLAERERVLKLIEACLEKQRREQHHHLGSDIERAIARIRKGEP